VVSLAPEKRLFLNARWERPLVSPFGKKPCDINKWLASERFRPAQRTSRPLCGRLIMRPADCVGGGRAHESFVVANPRRGSVMIDIRRRDFISLLGDTAAWHCKPRTQQPEQTRRGEPMGDAVTTVRAHHSVKVKSTAILLIVAAAFFPGRVAARVQDVSHPEQGNVLGPGGNTVCRRRQVSNEWADSD
jgi:hypothetical protein